MEELLATVTDVSDRVHANAEYAKSAATGAEDVKNMIERSNAEMRQLVDRKSTRLNSSH